MKRFDADSFGSMCPENWEEIADYLNNKLEAGEDPDEIWETYCRGGYQDAPEAIMESRRELDEMPFDKDFGYGLIHATGFEVYRNGEWWNEYQDADGELFYGR